MMHKWCKLFALKIVYKYVFWIIWDDKEESGILIQGSKSMDSKIWVEIVGDMD